jgi:23S rRNA (guanosine2251-2'-O)-methyltransferase
VSPARRISGRSGGPGPSGGRTGKAQGPGARKVTKAAPKAAGKSAGRATAKSAGPKAAGPKSAGPRAAGAPAAGPRSAGPRGPKRYQPARQSSDRSLGGEQIEGRQAVRELLLAGRRKVYEIWIATDVDDNDVVSDIVDLAADQRVPVVEVNRRRLDTVARSEAPQGVLAKAAGLPEVDLDVLLRRRPGRPPFLLAVDGVTDPGNLGALLRTAEGAGVTGVILPRHRSVHVTPTVAKAAAGAIEYLRMAVVPGLPAALAACRQKGLWVVGLDDAADRSLFELGDLGRDGVVMVLGAEGAGLSRLARERCDVVVSIPMRGRVGSLNVSNAGALALYEVTRQRAGEPLDFDA